MSNSSESIKVLAFSKCDGDKTEVAYVTGRGSVDKSCQRCINPQDSIYLGQAYQRAVLSEDDADTFAQNLNEFKSRLKEVTPRCEEMELSQWQYRAGYCMEIDENTPVFDPSEDYDKSNWLSQGWV